MEYLFDTANLDEIQKYQAIFPFTGVTTNPTILKQEGKVDFFDHFRKIRALIGDQRSLHIQIVSETAAGIVAEAHALLEKIDSQVFIKIPVHEAGLAAMQILKKEGVGITATAIYTEVQALTAVAAGADSLAVYFNRMDAINIDPCAVIANTALAIRQTGSNAKILGASFKNIGQVNRAFAAGAAAVTIQPDLLHHALQMPSITQAVADFKADWQSLYGDRTIADL